MERKGLSHQRAWVLVLPDHEPILLTSPSEEAPSLWNAAVSFVLADMDDEGRLSAIETAWQAFLQPPDATARRAAIAKLEETIAHATEMRGSLDHRVAELGVLLHLVAEDSLCRIYGEPPLFDEPTSG